MYKKLRFANIKKKKSKKKLTKKFCYILVMQSEAKRILSVCNCSKQILTLYLAFERSTVRHRKKHISKLV